MDAVSAFYKKHAALFESRGFECVKVEFALDEQGDLMVEDAE